MSATTPDIPPAQSRWTWLAAMWQRCWAGCLTLLDGAKLFSDRLLSLLRLFAVAGLLLILLFVVQKALQNAQLVLAKPFTVPKVMSDIHPDAGRILAATLKQQLLAAEQDIYNTVKRTSNDGQIDIGTVTGSGDEFLLGANLKLPETGITLNDVVEFIASLFGRRNIVGTVYQDQGKLFMQVELDGRSLTLERDLNARDPKALNMDLLKEMLAESRIELLSIASPNHNLFYYCSGQIDTIHHSESPLASWFTHCSQLRDPQLTPEALGKLIEQLQAARHRHQRDRNDTLRHVIGQTLGMALDKTQLLCPAYAQTQICQADGQEKAIALRIPAAEPINPQADPAQISILPQLPDARAFAPLTAEPMTQIAVLPNPAPTAEPSKASTATAGQAPDNAPSPPAALASPASVTLALPSVHELQQECHGLPKANDLDILASNRLEGDATLLANNQRPIQALETYISAIRQHCQNAFAWANMGVLLLNPAHNNLYQPSEAQAALEEAVRLNPNLDWVQNSLCLARAQQMPPTQAAELLKTDPACRTARALNPANKLLLDKHFFIGLAEYATINGDYHLAFAHYQTALSTDRKRDCTTSKAIEQLAILESQHGVTGAKQAACAILKDALPLPTGKASACEAKLAAFPCP